MRFAKSILSSLLIGSLIVATMGVTFSKHYCMGRLKDVSIFSQTSSCQPVGEENCAPDCCKDIKEKWQLIDLEHQLSSITLTTPNLLSVLTFSIPANITQNLLRKSLQFCDSSPPPSTPIYISHQVFRI